MSSIAKFILPGIPKLVKQSADAGGYPVCTALSRLLSRSNVASVSISEFESVLFAEFGIKRQPDQDLPIAAVTYFAETGERSPEWLMRLDPVHLQADVADSLLLDNGSVGVSIQEAAALLDTLKSYFSEYTFLFTEPNHWYLKSVQAFSMHTRNLSAITGSYINRCLPVGRDALSCLKLLTEIQMMLFKHAVNRVREQEGRLLINSVWPYGSGYLPKVAGGMYRQIFSNDALTKGLAHLSEAKFNVLPKRCLDLSLHNIEGPMLLVDTRFLNLQALNKAEIDLMLEQYETDWFDPLLQAVKDGDISLLELDFCDERIYRVTKSSLRRFWKRIQPWHRFWAMHK